MECLMALKGNMAGKKPEDAKQTAENRGEPQTRAPNPRVAKGSRP
jgi:hypothetical protein